MHLVYGVPRVRRDQTITLPALARRRPDRRRGRAGRGGGEGPARSWLTGAVGEERRPPLRGRSEPVRHRGARCGRARHGRRPVRSRPRHDRQARGSPNGTPQVERRLGGGGDPRQGPARAPLDARPRDARRLLRDATHARRPARPPDHSRRPAAGVGRAPAGSGRSRARRRGSFPPALVSSGRDDGVADPGRCSRADAAVPPLWRRSREHRPQR